MPTTTDPKFIQLELELEEQYEPLPLPEPQEAAGVVEVQVFGE